MNLSLKIARRYLFAKKHTNAINIITGIAVFGLTVGTAAMVLVLSVFNGFEDLISSMYSDLNPDLLVTPKKGKTFSLDDSTFARLEALPGVEVISKTLQEKAYFDSRDNRTIGIIKGVDEYYNQVTRIDSAINEGVYGFSQGDKNYAVMGYGMRSKLAVSLENPFEFINVYTIKRGNVGPFEQAFRKRVLYPAGTVFIEPEFNANYVLASLEFVQQLLRLGDQVSALEIKLYPGFLPDNTAKGVSEIIGEGYYVKDRFAQNEAFLKLMQIEKWMSFAIVGLMLLLVAFNMIGALWMIVLEKRKDIAILKSMGASDTLVGNIFLQQGVLLTALGVIVGFGFALIVFFIQKRFGIIGIPGTFTISAYPISLRFFDFIAVGITVMGIGLLASTLPARRAKRSPAMIREE